ncbi:thiamine pyrophosphate-binding protein [Fictibacillus barbaricus]|uniref:Acetolactate synthase-1/2/3 large subunit n=1 Tax=Fictibacillus barbaricus TaxID=182136 RepID=A0ABU1U1D4_9BACL|nr:thiamine pyrophosphate-binding protein [Fictibacillus barbaricus]MDR7073300.1 acetolactate synthase-1/2/3 large subunit [Fictibacillus barbaricus]
MKAVKSVLDFLRTGGVEYIFGIPAGSVNAFFDELYEMPEIKPIVTKHEGAASYMAASYAKYSKSLGVCIASSGPGATNLITGAANAMREHLPVLFLTGAVPVNTEGLNASQELDADPIFKPVTKYSVTVRDSSQLLEEVAKAVEIALSGVPGPVHVAMPIDVQLETVDEMVLPAFPKREVYVPEASIIQDAARIMVESKGGGYVFIGQGIRGSVELLVELAELLEWPIVSTPQAKGFIPTDHPLNAGVFGFAGHESASELINDGAGSTLLVIGSSLGETATNNWNSNLAKERKVIQIDFDESVFNRKYEVNYPIHGDVNVSLEMLIGELHRLGLERTGSEWNSKKSTRVNEEYNTQNVLLKLQEYLPKTNRYTIDIGEFMSYVIHYMKVLDSDTFDINVHFGAMGSGLSAAFGSALAESERPVACITGDGCFFMHGMEVLTAKEYNLPILFVVMNNARLGMVYHGHSLQYKRSHPSFEQEPVNISKMAEAFGIPSARVESLEDINLELLSSLQGNKGPAVLEIALVDNNVPPMGDRVKFLSSFGK